MGTLGNSDVGPRECVCWQPLSGFRKKSLNAVDEVNGLTALYLMRMTLFDQKGNREVAAYFVYQVHNHFTFRHQHRDIPTYNVRLERNSVPG